MLKNINLKQATATSLLITMMLSFGYGLAEPAFLQAVEDQFTVKQTITAEITFATPANDVVMNGSIAGITGGTSYGTSTSVVTTNNNTGFTMTLTASSSPAMVGDGFAGTIADYTPATTGIPDFTFSVPTGAEFGFSVSASTTANLAQKFKDDGITTCNTGSADTSAGSCWMGLSTVATSTIVTSAATSASGATSSIYFRTFLNSGGLTIEDTYTATMTQTAIIN